MSKINPVITKLRAELAISKAETTLSNARHTHLCRLSAYNERFDVVPPKIKDKLLNRLIVAEEMVIDAKEELRKAKRLLKIDSLK